MVVAMSGQVKLNVFIPAKLKDRVARYASDKGISEAAAVRLLLDEALTRHGVQ